MDQKLRQRLVEAARAGELVHYTELEEMLHLSFDSPNDRRIVGEYLGEITRFEVNEGRPMLSSVVWHKDMSGPGKGFYTLAVELGLADESDAPRDVAVRELKRTNAYWANH